MVFQTTLVPDDGRSGSDRPAGSDAGNTTITQPAADVEYRRELSLGAPRPVPGYRLQRKLGRGTFGEVWLAEDELTQRPVAIKFLHHGTGRDWEAMLEEVKRLARVDSEPSVVHLLAVDRDGDPPCYIMSYAEGGSLAERLPHDDSHDGAPSGADSASATPAPPGLGPLPVAESLFLFRRVAESLAGIHVKGICHCDLKPANILLDGRGRPLIADFGQARISRDATVSLGTYFYMAPEQADMSDQRPDLRWDVYALGAIVFQCLTGRPPRYNQALRHQLARAPDLASRLDIYRQQMLASPTPREHHAVRGLHRDDARVIDRCLELDPEKRFRDTWEIVSALDRCEQRRRARNIRNIAFALSAAAVLLMSVWAFWSTMKEIGEAKDSQIKQSTDDFGVVARLLGNTVSHRIAQSRQLVDQASADPELCREIGLISERHGTPGLALIGERLAGRARQSGFDGLTIADANGRILVSAEPREDQPLAPWAIKSFDPIDAKQTNISYREWFNGGQDGPARLPSGQPAVFSPLTRLHISRPYWSRHSEADTHRRTPSFGPAISAPIQYQGRTVGVIAGQLASRTIDEWMNELDLPGGFAVLLSPGCVIQSHPGFHAKDPDPKRKAERIMNEPENNGHAPGKSVSSCAYCLLMASAPSGKGFADHQDPLYAQKYVANISSIESQSAGGWDEIENWHVVVQKNSQDVVGEIEDIEMATRIWWAGAPGVILGCMAILWLLSERLLMDRKRLSRIMKLFARAPSGGVASPFDRAYPEPSSSSAE